MTKLRKLTKLQRRIAQAAIARPIIVTKNSECGDQLSIEGMSCSQDSLWRFLERARAADALVTGDAGLFAGAVPQTYYVKPEILADSQK